VIPNYPTELEAIIMKALERDIDKRFQTADEFRDALETYLVEQRILVPAAGVKGLLRKVLGPKIDQRRQQIRNALRALDGFQNAAALVSEESVLNDDDAVSVSESGPGPARDSSVSQSQNLGAAFLPGDGSSGIQTLSQPSGPPTRTNRFLLMGTAVGVVVSGAAFLLVGLHRSASNGHEAGEGAKAGDTTTSVLRTASGAEVSNHQPRGLSIDSLPEDPVAAAAAAAAAAIKARDPGAAPSAEKPGGDRLNQDIAALRPLPKAPETTHVTLVEAQEKDRVNSIASGVTLDDHGAPPRDPPLQLSEAPSSDIDKSALASVLGRAANMVGVCHRPGGESGPGKAVVTFGPSGRVQSVVVEGKLAGTAVGDCVVGQFRNVKIPAFSGNSVTVSKAFNVSD
jgi:hypothetical protein